VEAFDLAENTDVSIIHIRLDIVPPSLAVENVPEEVTTPFVWINGTTDTGVAEVFVEGVSYAVTEGAFKIQWSLAAGENNLVVEVYDEAGNRAESKVNTYYDPPAPPPPPTDGGDETNWLSVMGIGILLAAIIILVTALFIVQSRRRR
jgi:hypothetical protein